MRQAILLTLILSATLHAQSPNPTAPTTTVPPRRAHQRQKIANLPPGSPILVRELYARDPTPCVLTWIDNTSLACEGMAGRVIYSASSLAAVTPDTPRNPHHIPVGFIVAAAAGGIIGGISGSQGNAGDTAAGVFIGAGFAAGFAGLTAAITPRQPAPTFGPQPFIRIPLRPFHMRFP